MIGWLLMAYRASDLGWGEGLLKRQGCCFQQNCWCEPSAKFWRLFDEAERLGFGSTVNGDEHG